MSLFAALVGDRRLYEISKADLTAFRSALHTFPERRFLTGETRKLRDNPNELVKLASAGRISSPMVGAATIIKHLRGVTSILRFASSCGDIAFNPSQGMQIQSAPPRRTRRAFTLEEVNSIFAQPLFTQCLDSTGTGVLKPGSYVCRDDRFWIPILLFLTGARAAEIAGLETRDVVTAGPHPHLLIQPNALRRLKNEASRRIVPLHPALITLGFPAWVEQRASSASEPLFAMVGSPSYREGRSGEVTDKSLAASSILRQFHRTILKAAHADGEGATTHSFRHTFEREMQHAISDLEVRRRLTGREVDGSVKSYTDSFPEHPEARQDYVARMSTEIARMTFRGVHLPEVVFTF